MDVKFVECATCIFRDAASKQRKSQQTEQSLKKSKPTKGTSKEINILIDRWLFRQFAWNVILGEIVCEIQNKLCPVAEAICSRQG